MEHNARGTSKFYPAGAKRRMVTMHMKEKKDKDQLLECGIDPDNPEHIEDLWIELGKPSAMVIICGYQIANGKIVKSSTYDVVAEQGI